MAKILVVDDDTALVEAVSEVLRSRGHTVVAAYNGEQGYQQAHAERPDLMLLDVMMTRDNEGFDIARRLKEDPVTRDLPVIIITGIRKAKRLPFRFEPDEDWLPVKAVLEKPLAPEVLLKHVDEILAGTGS